MTLPLPPIDSVTAPWWEATRAGRLLVQHCTSCGASQFYPRTLCTRCGAADSLGWRETSGEAVVDTWTVVHRAPVDGLVVPYVVARVRLVEGPTLLTWLVDASLDEALAGRAVRLAWRPLPDGRQLPVFTMADPSREPLSLDDTGR